MQFSVSSEAPDKAESSWLLAFVNQDAEFDSTLTTLDEALDGGLTRMKEREDLTGKSAEVVVIPDVPAIAADRLVLVGLGKADKLTIDGFHKSLATAVRRIAKQENSSLTIAAPQPAIDQLGKTTVLERIADAVTVCCAPQNLYQAEKDRFEFENVTVISIDETVANEDALERGQAIGTAVNLTRELVNRHADDIYPETFAARAADEAANLDIRGEVFDLEMLQDEKMGAMLAVSKGSDREPRMVVLNYQGNENGPTIGLVGKGVTFDSGGLSIKTSAGMITMKCDMAGAATVLGVVTAIARLKLPVNVIGVMGLVENMTGGSAYKLGDVLTTRNGTTVEVHNTDAEGRLVLADALAFTVDQKVDHLIDLATLTGACVVALGEQITGAFSNDQDWCDQVMNSAREAGEQVWQLPMYDEFADQLKSEYADCKNIGTRWGGSITAAKFLEKFVDETPWVHLDIAGPSFSDSGSGHQDSGGTGAMVRGLIQLLRSN